MLSLGTSDAPRLHLQPCASPFQHCGGRDARVLQPSLAGFGSC